MGREGLCLGFDTSRGVHSNAGLLMRPCSDQGTTWYQGIVRGKASLENADYVDPEERPYCVHIGVYTTNNTCRVGPHQPKGNNHDPHIRQCIDDNSAASNGGNPIGCAFKFSAAAGTIVSDNCVDEPDTCLGVVNKSALAIVSCGATESTGWKQDMLGTLII